MSLMKHKLSRLSMSGILRTECGTIQSVCVDERQRKKFNFVPTQEVKLYFLVCFCFQYNVTELWPVIYARMFSVLLVDYP